MVREISVSELARKRAAGEALYLLDVRQPEEYALAALPDSVLIPLPELSMRVREVQPAPGALVVVYCHHGIRSLAGAALLERWGLAKVVSLAGGIDAWSREVDPNVPRY